VQNLLIPLGLGRSQKVGPAIIGYGRVTGEPGRNDAGERVVPIKFEGLVDPSTEVLVGRDTLLAIRESHHVWRIPFSGMKLDELCKHVMKSNARPPPPR
jgi:hypothetical protein